MQSTNYAVWAVALSLSIHVCLASPAPFQSVHDRAASSMSSEVPLGVYSRQDPTQSGELASGPLNMLAEPGDSDANKVEHQLPPVSQVFQMMEVTSGLLLSSTTTLISPTTTSQTMTEATGTIFIGPGLVIPSTPVTNSESAPTGQPTVTSPALPDAAPHNSLVPTRKLVVIASVMAVIIGLTFCIYAMVNRRVCGLCRRQKKTPRETWVKFGLSPDKEKEPTYIVPWLEYSPSPSTRGLSIEPNPPRTQALPPSQASKIVDITPDFPPSKFSVTSSEYPSDYPSSTGSSPNSSLLAILPARPDNPSRPSASPLMSPSEFFCLPSAPDLHSDSHHSRAQSAPVFCHSLPPCDPSSSKMRSANHRRSKSVSGLTYIVESPRTTRSDAGSSGEWKRNSPQTGGLPNGF